MMDSMRLVSQRVQTTLWLDFRKHSPPAAKLMTDHASMGTEGMHQLGNLM